MHVMGRHPDRVRGRHDPLLRFQPDRQQPAQRTHQLAARMPMRLGLPRHGLRQLRSRN